MLIERKISYFLKILVLISSIAMFLSNDKRSKGRKNKLDCRTVGTPAIAHYWTMHLIEGRQNFVYLQLPLVMFLSLSRDVKKWCLKKFQNFYSSYYYICLTLAKLYVHRSFLPPPFPSKKVEYRWTSLYARDRDSKYKLE